MSLFDEWCKNTAEEDGQKLFLKFTEKPGGRAATQAQLSETIRSHYDSLKRICRLAQPEILGDPKVANGLAKDVQSATISSILSCCTPRLLLLTCRIHPEFTFSTCR